MRSVAIIGGTGSRSLVQGAVREELRLRTPHGPVDVVRFRRADAVYHYIHRHGPGHALAPHAVNHRGHMQALRQLGVGSVIGVYAVGSLRPGILPGDLVALDDFIGYREIDPPCDSSEPTGGPRHLDFSTPYCAALRGSLVRSLSAIPRLHASGVYVQTVGPRYETPAEVTLYAGWGGDVVGMTGASEAICAREAGLCYAGLACVTNLGSGLSPQAIEHGRVAASMRTIVVEVRPHLLDALDRVRGLPACPDCQAAVHSVGSDASPASALNS